MSKTNSGLFNTTSGNSNHSSPGIVTGGDSGTLGKNMLKSMGVDGNHKWSGYQAQHIIPAEMANHPVLQKIGFDLDASINGIFLRIPGQNDVSPMSRHRGYHAIYSQFVREQLDKININSSPARIRYEVSKLQSDLRRLQESGLPLYRERKRKGYRQKTNEEYIALWRRQLKRIQ